MADRPDTRADVAFKRQAHGSMEADALAALSENVDLVVDALGTFCPEPVIRTQNAVRDADPGAIVMLLADDMGVEVDIPAWCMSTRNEFLGIVREPRLYRVFVRRTATAR